MVNLCIFMGNLTRDPELRYVGANNTPVCNFSIAVNRRYKGTDGKQHEEVTFVDCEAWQKTAEVAAEYLKKGRMVVVEAECRDDVWTDKESGQNRRKKKFVVGKLNFVPTGGGGSDREETTQTTPKEEPVAAGVGDDEEVPF